MAQTIAVAVAQAEEIPVKPSANPDAYYSPAEATDLGFGSYLTQRRAVKAGRLRAHYLGRSVKFRGSDLVSWLEGKSQK